MASFSVTGSLLEAYDTQQVSDKFRKREFVLDVPDGQYPQQIKFQLVQDKVSLLDNLHPGDELTVHFNLRGRGFNKNGQMSYFTNLEAWKIEPSTAATPAAAAQPTSANRNPGLRAQASVQPIDDEDENQLPF